MITQTIEENYRLSGTNSSETNGYTDHVCDVEIGRTAVHKDVEKVTILPRIRTTPSEAPTTDEGEHHDDVLACGHANVRQDG
jgi:hypothetical protein